MSSGRPTFAADRRKRTEPACIPRKTLVKGELLAEVIENRRSQEPLFFSVVQRQGRPELLFLGQFESEAAAAAAAEEFISDYLRRQETSNGDAA